MPNEQDNPDIQTLHDGVEADASAHEGDRAVGSRVGNIEIVAEVGRGNMGTVYRAVHQTLGTPYAVKVLHKKYSQDVNAAERFRREALVCSQLRHPNVVFVTDFGFQKDLGIYIIMEFLDGVTLSTLIAQGPMDAVRTCHLAAQIAEALEAAHELKVIHRDLKPDNITILDQGRGETVKVLDFGIASMKARHASAITTQGMVLGTPAYMAPEQVQGLKDKLGPRSDIYALGCILYEMLTGKLPFFSDSPLEVCRMHILDPPPPLSGKRPDLADTMLERLVHWMLEKRAERRPSSMREVQMILEEAAYQLVHGVHDEVSEPSPRSGESARATRITGESESSLALAQKFWRACPGGQVARLLSSDAPLLALDDEHLFLLLWVPVARGVLDPALESPDFEQGQVQLQIYLNAVLDAERLSFSVRDQILRCVGDLMRVVDRERQQWLVKALQPMTHHSHFPVAILPGWARAYATGTWKPVRRDDGGLDLDFAGQGAAQLLDPPPEDEEGALPSLFELSLDQGAGGSLMETGPAGLDAEDEGLIEKLRQPINVRNIKTLLGHEIFVRKKGD